MLRMAMLLWVVGDAAAHVISLMAQSYDYHYHNNDIHRFIVIILLQCTTYVIISQGVQQQIGYDANDKLSRWLDDDMEIRAACVLLVILCNVCNNSV
jgi:hypothetical protein